MASSSSSLTASVDHRYTYDVFLSFRGVDIRKSFMDHLFSDLKRRGIFPFRDDQELKCGDKIDSGLGEAITKSRVLVVIFTKSYATSTWCLDELVQILRYNETAKDLYHVRAIFYDVDRSVVQNHSDSYQAALDKHESRKNKEVPRWKEALAKGALLPGWDLQNFADGSESDFIDEVSKEIFELLRSHGPSYVGENLVDEVSKEIFKLLRDRGPFYVIENLVDEVSKEMSKLLSNCDPFNVGDNRVHEVSEEIFKLLIKRGPLDLGDNLVGLHSRAVQMNLSRFADPSKVHMIGICGTSGVGKTITAQAVYNLLQMHFEGCSFCEDVKGTVKTHGLPYVQNQLLDDITKAGDEYIRSVGQGISVIKQRMSYKKVLIVLDDVTSHDQFKALAGNPNWFGPGSLIIVTGKDRQLLSSHGVGEILEIELLDQEESIKLFSLYAFKENKPKEEFLELSNIVVHHVNGHPLALKVLGCFLFGKNVEIWKSEVGKLKINNTFEIQQVLKLSYDGLDSNQQDIFLDIACLFSHENQEFVKKLLDACNLFADTEIRVLVDKSFVTVSKGVLKLHDLLKRMGKQVVREESENPGKRSRSWSQKDSYRILNRDMGTKSIKGFKLCLTGCPKVHIDSKSFSRMNELRILKIEYRLLRLRENGRNHHCIIFEDTKVDHSNILEFLSNELRWLCWHGYPFEFLPETFYPESLVALNLSYGNIKQLWTGNKSFEKLTLVELRYCHQLIKTPDFTCVPNLEELFLESCTNLIELHPSVGYLKKLTVLNCKNCKKLKSLPEDLELESLQILLLSGCLKLDSLPEGLGESKALVELHADGTNVQQFPSSIKYLNNLQALSIGGHKSIQEKSWKSNFSLSILPWKKQDSSPLMIMPSLSGLRLIRNLDVGHCKLSDANLKEICSLSLLEKLNLSGNDFVSLPSGFAQLSGLKMLGLVGCKNLLALPELPSEIAIIDAQDCTALQEVPSVVYESKSIRFDFSNCSTLAKNQTIESLASMFLPQQRVDPYKTLNLFLPGSIVPAWFTNRNPGRCVRLELPQPWSYSKFKGFVTCAVFAPQNANGSKSRMIDVSYCVRSFNDAFVCGSSIETRIFPNERRCYESDQVWLSYMVPKPGWKRRWENAKDYIDVHFRICGICCEVKECGVRLVYVDDEVESSSRITEWLPYPAEHEENVGSIFSLDSNDIIAR